MASFFSFTFQHTQLGLHPRPPLQQNCSWATSSSHCQSQQPLSSISYLIAKEHLTLDLSLLKAFSSLACGELTSPGSLSSSVTPSPFPHPLPPPGLERWWCFGTCHGPLSHCQSSPPAQGSPCCPWPSIPSVSSTPAGDISPMSAAGLRNGAFQIPT